LKLKRFRIRNYKALDNLTVDVPDDPLFLIGVNGAGKTSVLQALSLIRYFAEGETVRFFKDRHWKSSDVRPRTVNVVPLRAAGSASNVRRLPSRNFNVALALEHRSKKIVWEFEWNYTSERTVRESVWVVDESSSAPRVIFSFPDESDAQPAPIQWSALRLRGSLIAVASAEAIAGSGDDADMLCLIQDWASGITSLELLNPQAMRGGVRGSYADIGSRGERLVGFLAGLSTVAKERIVKRMADFYPIRHLDTTRKRAGWIDMKVAEAFRLFGRINVGHMSDGFLRILALCAIPEFNETTSVVLLDEVEDGIEPHILPRIIERVSQDASSQIILTSHSPLLINFFEQDQIYLFSRDAEGRTIAANASALPLFRRGHDFMGSGEIWANAQRNTIQRAVRTAPRGDRLSQYLSSADVLNFIRD
jgi:ABC-type multidrug transport system ATPase subunit